jgi:hypothetical protein
MMPNGDDPFSRTNTSWFAQEKPMPLSVVPSFFFFLTNSCDQPPYKARSEVNEENGLLGMSLLCVL